MNRFLLMLSFLFCGFQLLAQERVAQAFINASLAHGQSLSVRQALVDLKQGDYVTRLEGYVKGNHDGAYLELVMDNTVIAEIYVSSATIGIFNIPIKKINGVNYRTLMLRSVGSTFIDSVRAYITVNAPAPLPPPAPVYPPDEPIPHLPDEPALPPTQPVPPFSLAGYCDDADHSQYYAANTFARWIDGLSMGPKAAADWAVAYNNSHRCGTIREYSDRFTLLRNIAMGTDALVMTRENAIRYALGKVETTTLARADALMRLLVYVKSFALAPSGLNLPDSAATDIAYQWTERGNCGDLDRMKFIGGRFHNEFNFARSSTGLNYNEIQAKQYALSKIRRLTDCGDLFRLP